MYEMWHKVTPCNGIRSVYMDSEGNYMPLFCVGISKFVEVLTTAILKKTVLWVVTLCVLESSTFRGNV
jgi:hypothetical protein